MSNRPLGPGWWQASDGQWYAPQAWQPAPSGPGPQQPWSQPGAPQPGAPQPGAPQPPKSSNRGCIIAAVVVVVLVLGAIGVGGYFLFRAASTVTEIGLGGVGGSATCPTASEISPLVGSAVREPQSSSLVGTTGCIYLAADQQAGVEVNLVIGPAFIADDKLKEFADEGRAARAVPEPISVGERGQAWTYPTKSAAIAVGGDHLVLVEIMSPSGSPIGDRKAAAIAVLSKVIG